MTTVSRHFEKTLAIFIANLEMIIGITFRTLTQLPPRNFTNIINPGNVELHLLDLRYDNTFANNTFASYKGGP